MFFRMNSIAANAKPICSDVKRTHRAVLRRSIPLRTIPAAISPLLLTTASASSM